jgi:hypothetical protein
MLVACRLAGLSAPGAHYAGVTGRAQCRTTQASSRAWLFCWEPNFTPYEAGWLALVDHVGGKRADFSQIQHRYLTPEAVR